MMVRAVQAGALLLVLLISGCSGEERAAPQLHGESISGDPRLGKAAIQQHGCGSCHAIPGVAGADGRVGPPLKHIAKRAYLGGVVPNTPEDMIRWIRTPEDIDPRTAMPNMGVSEEDARHIAAYLYTLE